MSNGVFANKRQALSGNWELVILGNFCPFITYSLLPLIDCFITGISHKSQGNIFISSLAFKLHTQGRQDAHSKRAW